MSKVKHDCFSQNSWRRTSGIYFSVFYSVKSTKRLLAHYTIDILHCLCVIWHVRWYLLSGSSWHFFSCKTWWMENIMLYQYSTKDIDMYSILPSSVITSAWYTQLFHPWWSPQLGILNSSILDDHLSLVYSILPSSVITSAWYLNSSILPFLNRVNECWTNLKMIFE